jgi:hypothetical protein
MAPLRQRQDVASIRRHAAVQGVEIDLLHRGLPVALRHRDPAVEYRDEVRPRRAESGVDAARAPFFGALANLVGRKKPFTSRASSGKSLPSGNAVSMNLLC